MFSGIGFFNESTPTPVICVGSPIDLSSLAAYYKFNSNSLDSSGNALDGTNFGSPTYTSGKFGDAISLDGTSQYVSVPDSTLLEGSVGNISVFGWVNLTDYTSDGNPHLASKWNAGFSLGWRVLMRSTDILVSIANVSTSRGTGVATGSWAHIGFTFNNSLLKVYQNGVQVGTDANLGARTLANTDAMNIGKRSTATDGYLKGLVDDISVWRRVLTSTEIATLYASSCPLNS